LPVAYKRFADIAGQMGVDTYGMADVQAAEATLAAAIRLMRDVGIPERGDGADLDRITNHVLGDTCTPGNAEECTFETVRPVVEHCMNGDLDNLLT
jgi:formaldehyde dismutase / methanol dehydrogenase